MLQIEEEEDLGPIPFRFSPLWIEQDGFMNIVAMAWELPVVGSPNFIWEWRLKNTKVALKAWAKSHKNPISEKIVALAALEKIQLEMEEYEITPALLEREQNAQFNSFRAF